MLKVDFMILIPDGDNLVIHKSRSYVLMYGQAVSDDVPDAKNGIAEPLHGSNHIFEIQRHPFCIV